VGSAKVLVYLTDVDARHVKLRKVNLRDERYNLRAYALASVPVIRSYPLDGSG